MSGPAKVLADDAGLEGGKRFRFTGLHTRLAKADAHPVSLQAVPTAEADVDTETSHLKTALAELAERNLSNNFTAFADEIRPKTLSLALVLRGRAWIVNKACDALRSAALEQHLAVEPIALCVAALARDLGTTYFLPFFPQIVAAFADVFSGEGATALLWDPELALLPVFSALAAITKVLVLQLVAEPTRTLVQISPLLAHEQYRIREMTAESCLGYIMRKTRQTDALHELVKAVLDSAKAAVVPDGKTIEQVPIVHGAGCAVFEAMRLPAGGLHLRALQVFETALAHTNVHSKSDEGPENAAAVQLEVKGCGNARFAVVVHCVARLCQHLKQKPDNFAEVVAHIVNHGSDGTEKGNAVMVAESLFLVRNCLNTSVSHGNSVLPDAYIQRVSNLALSSLENFPAITRICHEAFSCFIVILERIPPHRSHRVTLSLKKALASSVDSMPPNSVGSMLRSLMTLLDKPSRKKVEFDQLVPIVALLSNSLAKRYGNTAGDFVRNALDSDVAMQGETESSQLFGALYALSRFIEATKGKSVECIAPDVNKLVVSGLDALVVVAEDKKAPLEIFSTSSTLPFPEFVQLVLRYSMLVQVPGAAPLLARLSAVRMRPAFTAIATSSALQYDASAFTSTNVDIETKLRATVKTLLRDLMNGSISVEVVSAINVYVRTRKASSLLSGIADEHVNALIGLLSAQLSSIEYRVRLECAALLWRLSVSKTADTSPEEMYSDVSTDESNAALLRSQLAKRRKSACPDDLVFKAILCVLTMPHELDRVITVREIIGQIAKLIQVPGGVSERVQVALCHFSIGVFSIRFKPLWEPSRKLWGALAEMFNDDSWVPMSRSLEDTCRSILSQLSPDHALHNSANSAAADNAEHVGDGEGQPEAVKTKEKRQGSGKKRPRPPTATLSQTGAKNKRKKQKLMEARGKFVLSWHVMEWNDALAEKVQMSSTGPTGSAASSSWEDGTRNEAVDSLTRHSELIKALSQFPKTTLKMRGFIVDKLYLALDPASLSRRTGDLLIRQYGSLLEKMGGMKICENDKQRYHRLRARLLLDLCRPCPAAQTEIMKCICASRSPELKPYKESLLRIIDEKTFRDEISMLTDTLGAKMLDGAPAEKAHKSRMELSDSMVDVLVRLCYSKTRGKKQRITAQRAAAISFVVTTLPRKNAVPNLLSLALDKMTQFVDKASPLSSREAKKFEVDLLAFRSHSPPENVCRGVLTSLESMLPQLRGFIPVASWREIGIALFLIFASSTRFRQGQDVRSDALRLFATMLEHDPMQTSFVCLPVLKTMSVFSFDISGAESVSAAPAFLKFLAACFRYLDSDVLSSIISDYTWACKWALQILRSETSSFQTVQLAVDIARGVIAAKKEKSITVPSSATKQRESEGLVNVLSDSLRIRLELLQEASDNNWHRQKSTRDSIELMMKVLMEMSSCSELDEDVMMSLADSLLFILTESKLYGAALVSSISAFTSLITRIASLTENDTSKKKGKLEDTFVPRLIPLLSSTSYRKQLDAKEGLCRALAGFSNDALRIVSYLVQDSIAMSSSRIGEADLDARVLAFSSMIKILKRSVSSESANIAEVPAVVQTDFAESKSFLALEKATTNPVEASCDENTLLLIAHAAVASVQDEDASVRGVASYCLQLLAKWASFSKQDDARAVCSVLGDLLTGHATSSCLFSSRREYARALGHLIRSIKTVPEYSSSGQFNELLVSLCHFADAENIETDFFENVVHLQVHRRSRAMRRLAKIVRDALDEPKSTPAYLEGLRQFIFPLSMRIALDSHEPESSKSARKSKESKEASMRDVTAAAISLNNAAACFLSWQDYRREVVSIIRRIPKETDDAQAEVLYSLLVGFSSAFPGMPVGESEQEASKKAQERFLRTYILPKMIVFITSGAVEGEVEVTLKNSKAAKTSGGDRSLNAMVFRAPVAVAVTKLLSQLQDDELNNRMPGLVAPLANALRSRMFAIRTAAKKALVDVVLLLDPKFFAYTVDQVLSALINGYRKDSVVYVVHALLTGIRDYRNNEVEGKKGVFLIDSAAKKLCDALADELEDGLHASRTDYINPNATGTRLREATHRALRVNDTAEILGELIDFSESAEIVMNPFMERLMGASSSKLSSRLGDALQRLVLGFSRNETLNGEDGLKFCFKLVSTHMPTPNMLTDEQEEDASLAKLQEQLKSLSKDRMFSNAPNTHVVAELGWQLLNNLMKNAVDANGQSEENRKAQAMLEPFVPEVLLSMRSRYDSLTHISLKCAQRLLRAPISGRAEVADIMAATTVDVLCRNLGVSINPGAPMGIASKSEDDGLFCTCLRAAAVLIQEVGYGEKKGVKKERVESLLKIARNVLDQNVVEARSAALVLIRSTVSGRIQIPAVYDTVEHVSKLAVRAQSTSLRTACTNIAVQFLIHFPLGNKRIRQHLEFFVRNLSYELAHGRIASIGVLVAFIEKVPEHTLAEECEYFFVSLLSVVARDDDPQCRKAAAEALKTLFSTLENGRGFSTLLGMCQSLIRGKKDVAIDEERAVDADILRSGAIGLSSAVQSGKLSRAQLQTSLGTLVSALSSKFSQPWESVHALLCCMEQLFSAQDENSNVHDSLEVQVALQPFWECINDYLLHSHEWIRHVSGRLLGRHLSASGGREAVITNTNSALFSILWSRTGLLRNVMKTLCLQFEANQVSEDLAKQSLKNLLCVANMTWKCPAAGNVAEGKMKVNELNEEENAGAVEDPNRPFSWLISRISGLCSRTGKEDSALLRRACGIRFFLIAVKWWGTEMATPRLHNFVSPIVQILESKTDAPKEKYNFTGAAPSSMNTGVEEGGSTAIDMDGLKVLALSLQDALVASVGAETYFTLYKELAAKRKAVKNEKKRQAAIQIAIDPERAAKRRRQKAASRAERRKKNPKNVRYGTKVTKASFQVFENNNNVLREED